MDPTGMMPTVPDLSSQNPVDTGDQGWHSVTYKFFTGGESRAEFLSILSIKRRNWFYWADRAETAERAESRESTVFERI